MAQRFSTLPQEPIALDEHNLKLASLSEKQKWDIVWRNVIILIIVHFGGFYGFYVLLIKAMWLTVLYVQMIVIHCAVLGVTAGAHRLWAHKSYKARLPLQIMLIIFNTICIQGPVIDSVRDHRMHHKYSETDADSHNAKREFFFAHIGWLLTRKHPAIKAKGNTIVMYYGILAPVANYRSKYSETNLVIPSYIATLWGESILNAVIVVGFYRCLYTWHATYLVNSVAHLWGPKPYDINPIEYSMVAYFALGEGYENYHHTFPWDYKTAELGMSLNLTKLFIDLMAKIGWAYDLKTASTDVINERAKRTGDGSHGVHHRGDKKIAQRIQISA